MKEEELDAFATFMNDKVFSEEEKAEITQNFEVDESKYTNRAAHRSPRPARA